MRYRLIPLDDKAAWDAALTGIPHGYAHTHWYNEAMAHASKRDIFLYAAQADNFQIVCPISPRQQHAADPLDITTPYGFSGFASSGEYDNFPAAWYAHMREQHYVCGHIALHPLLEKNNWSSNDCHAGKKTYVLDLSPSLEAILQGFAHGHRYDLKQWQKKSFTLSMEKSAEVITQFAKLHADFARRKEAAPVYHFEQTTWDIILNSEHTTLISIMHEGQLAAAAVFILYGDVADYFMAASTPNGRIHSKAIIWEAIKLAKNKNMVYLHLGCGVQANDELEQFKARFGGESRETFALKAIYDMVSYDALCHKYAANSKELSGYFPSYWNTSIKRS